MKTTILWRTVSGPWASGPGSFQEIQCSDLSGNPAMCVALDLGDVHELKANVSQNLKPAMAAADTLFRASGLECFQEHQNLKRFSSRPAHTLRSSLLRSFRVLRVAGSLASFVDKWKPL